ncbi:recombinase family protein [Echinicola marina]|uniref:recombinase family protein n=1 Tax=Echinicola marina TaxID=2859768 RepID=UPI001CF6CDB1|nr:recombinase family protein [Echinicola marina]UCS92341.1 recombinase family protein [Echinicola marina]
MKVADLYIRVSTDEQADKGYSQRNQEEMLRKYCNTNGIIVNRVVFEDFSAKTFFRPEWSKLLAQFENQMNTRSNLLLFTKWDRFSRNAGDAYMMINTLRKLGIEPQAIEQPLDLSVPENKMMLAFYLAAPEVENDRRALNVIHGMRRALKEGRWLWHAPYGYKNTKSPDGRPTIEIMEDEAKHMRWIFNKILEGTYSSENVLLMARRRGAQLKKNRFWGLIRKEFYCGKILVPEYNGEQAYYVKGQHVPLISESDFYRIQEILEAKKKKIRRVSIISNDEVPLRGFLNCPKCSYKLTASASKGRNKYYHYYHCTSKCGVRFRAAEVNRAFIKELRKFRLQDSAEKLFEIILNQVIERENKTINSERNKLVSEIEVENNKLSKARKLLLEDTLSPEDFKLIKEETLNKISILETQIDKIRTKPKIDNQNLLRKALKYVSRLDELFEKLDNEGKRKLIGSMYKENWVFDGITHRTTLTNEVARSIYLINKYIWFKKRSPKSKIETLDTWVGPPGLEPGTP